MVKNQKILQILLASPDDVPEERHLVEEVINEFNNTWSGNQGIRLELIKWETHSRPGVGEDAQDVINSQLGEEYDVFLGIMWTRFGTPTGRANSGTEEEFERAYRRKIQNGDNIELLFYFKNAEIKPNEIDIDQLSKILLLKKKFRDEIGVLYREFNTTEEFGNKIRMDLSTLVQNWNNKNKDLNVETIIETEVPKTTRNPRPISPNKHEQNEDGLLDLIEYATEAILNVNSAVVAMAEATNDVGDKFTHRTDALNVAIDSDPATKKRLINKAASDLEIYAKRMAVEVDVFKKYQFLTMDTFGKIAILLVEDFPDQKSEIIPFFDDIKAYFRKVQTARKSMNTFRDTISGLPRMTKKINQAKRRTVVILDDLDKQLETAEYQAADVVEFLNNRF